MQPSVFAAARDSICRPSDATRSGGPVRRAETVSTPRLPGMLQRPGQAGRFGLVPNDQADVAFRRMVTRRRVVDEPSTAFVKFGQCEMSARSIGAGRSTPAAPRAARRPRDLGFRQAVTSRSICRAATSTLTRGKPAFADPPPRVFRPEVGASAVQRSRPWPVNLHRPSNQGRAAAGRQLSSRLRATGHAGGATRALPRWRHPLVRRTGRTDLTSPPPVGNVPGVAS